MIGVEEDNGNIIYNRTSFIRGASDFGIPQKRPRIYIMGFKKELVKNVVFEELLVKRSQKHIYKDLNDLLDTNVKPNFYVASGYLNTLKEHRRRHGAKGNGSDMWLSMILMIPAPLIQQIRF
ncbi:MAG: DNA cytosine methyltransferase [Brevinema sp.]